MKVCSNRTSTLHLLLLFLAISTTKASGGDEATPRDKLREDLKKYFDGLMKPLKVKRTDIDDTKFEYNIPDKEASIVIEESETQFNVTLQNKYETQTLELENIDFATEQKMIQENYIDKFMGHVAQIQGKLPDMFESVKAGLEEARFSGMYGETKFIGVAPDKSSTEEELVFSMEYDNPAFPFAKDQIIGELLQSDEGYYLNIITKFFQKSFQLAVTTDGYLQGEARKLAEKSLAHLESLYYLNEDRDQQAETTSFEYAAHMGDLEKVIKANLGQGMSVTMNDNGFSISIESGVAAQGEFGMEMAGGIGFNVLKVTAEVLNGQVYTLVFPNKAIYNLNGLVDKFVSELVETIKYSMTKMNPDDSLKVFK